MKTDMATTQIRDLRLFHLDNLLSLLSGQGFLCRIGEHTRLASFLFLALIYVSLQMKQRMKYRLSLTFARLNFIRTVFSLRLQELSRLPAEKLTGLKNVTHGKATKMPSRTFNNFHIISQSIITKFPTFGFFWCFWKPSLFLIKPLHFLNHVLLFLLYLMDMPCSRCSRIGENWKKCIMS